MEVGGNPEGALQDLLGWQMLVPRAAAVPVAPGMLCLLEGVWTHLVILAVWKDRIQAVTAKGAF